MGIGSNDHQNMLQLNELLFTVSYECVEWDMDKFEMLWKCLRCSRFNLEGPMLNGRVILYSCLLVLFIRFISFSGWYFRSGRFLFLFFFCSVPSIIAAVLSIVQGNADTNNNRRTKEDKKKKVHNVKKNQESFSRKSKIKSWTCILRAISSSNGMHITKSLPSIGIRAKQWDRERVEWTNACTNSATKQKIQTNTIYVRHIANNRRIIY